MNESNDINENTIMDTLSANEAKTQFGDLLLKAQRSPVQINKNGKPVPWLSQWKNTKKQSYLSFDICNPELPKQKMILRQAI